MIGSVSEGPHIVTEGLLLRRWNEKDRVPFAEMNADPEVMAYFPAALARAESNALLDRNESHFRLHGYGLWALEDLRTGRFVGLTGLAVVNFAAPFAPAVEIGWGLARAAWG